MGSMMATTAPALRTVGRPPGVSDPPRRGLKGKQREMVLGRLSIVLGHGMFDAARRIIDEAEREFFLVPDRLSLDTPLADTTIGDHTRVLNQLDQHGILTVGELLGTTRIALLLMKNLGPRAVEDIVEFALAAAKEIEAGADATG